MTGAEAIAFLDKVKGKGFVSYPDFAVAATVITAYLDQPLPPGERRSVEEWLELCLERVCEPVRLEVVR